MKNETQNEGVLAQVERNMILRYLHETNGNRTAAAEILGISIRTLRNKLAQYRKEGHTIPGDTSPNTSKHLARHKNS